MSMEYAHIIADSEDGPRGNTQSPIYAGDIDNIIILCPTCHTKVDKNLSFYTIDYLRKMKKDHEDKVNRLLNSLENKEALIVKYASPIGRNRPVIDENKMDEAIRESGYISSKLPIDLNPNNTAFNDSSNHFWQIELEQLRGNFSNELVGLQKRREIKPILLFAIAPQPLLIQLGVLFNDLSDVHVFQKRREPDTWTWNKKADDIVFKITAPKEKHTIIAVNLSLSDTITTDRIHAVLGNQVSVWTITHDSPHNDFITHPKHLKALRKTFRDLFRQVREFHGQSAVLNVFPACPVSASVEFGRVWMPKVDATLKLYDHNKATNRFELVYDFSM